jgi:hypothetical protein
MMNRIRSIIEESIQVKQDLLNNPSIMEQLG